MSIPRKENARANQRARKAGRTRMSAKQRAAKLAAQRAAYREAGKAPPTPLMLSPFQACEQLCARTGARINLCTFYRWILQLKIASVRMGRKIFIPISEMDVLIGRCQRGERN